MLSADPDPKPEPWYKEAKRGERLHIAHTQGLGTYCNGNRTRI
jgi:hypothetical protein